MLEIFGEQKERNYKLPGFFFLDTHGCERTPRLYPTVSFWEKKFVNNFYCFFDETGRKKEVGGLCDELLTTVRIMLRSLSLAASGEQRECFFFFQSCGSTLIAQKKKTTVMGRRRNFPTRQEIFKCWFSLIYCADFKSKREPWTR